jgi:hypothetical protein
MPKSKNPPLPPQKRVRLDLNNPVFQENWFQLTDKTERNRVTDTLKKILNMTWQQVYSDTGLKWEKIVSVSPPPGVAAIYSIRVTLARRATVYREGDYMRFLTVQADHDATYGKK